MKVLLDGIEVALPAITPLDLNSIERVEVIRGPQAAAIYGSDAIGGVIQIFTKRGEPNVARPQVDGRVALGIIQTPYDGFGGVLRQNYAASVHGGGTDVSYNLGGGYSHTGDWLPNGELSKQSNPSFYGGMHFGHGIVAVDLSGRYYTQNNPAVADPGLTATGLSFFSAPARQHQQVQNHTVGARLGIAPLPWWQHTISLGLDRYTLDDFNTGPRFTYPGDTLLLVLNQNRTKTSIGYNTSVHGSLGNALSGSLTAGFDHYSLPATQFISIGALNTTGAIKTDPNLPFSVSRTITNNTGFFTQAQLGYRDALFLTAGLRAEKNSDFGDSLGTPVSPQGGMTYVRQFQGATLKLRGSWGRAIRPPAPGLKFATPGGAGGITLPNPVLGPERQQGWDAGIDGVFGGHGSLSFTFYNQIAEDLIQSVSLPSDSVPTTQNQNVGRVKNTGIEIEGTLFIGVLTLKAQYGYARSRIEQLAPGYTGDLQVGDQALATPKHTAGAALTFAPPTGTTLTAGLAYVGSWRNYDYFAQFSCYGGTGPCQASNRDYIVSYPGFVRLSAGVSQQLTSLVSAFLQVDNLSNNEAFELDDLSPVMGRITTLGLQLRY
jgi:outer membrane receptor protein involved in Fe transport